MGVTLLSLVLTDWGHTRMSPRECCRRPGKLCPTAKTSFLRGWEVIGKVFGGIWLISLFREKHFQECQTGSLDQTSAEWN
jgi:hypothetical protein